MLCIYRYFIYYFSIWFLCIGEQAEKDEKDRCIKSKKEYENLQLRQHKDRNVIRYKMIMLNIVTIDYIIYEMRLCIYIIVTVLIALNPG